jgi:hypothetical protein
MFQRRDTGYLESYYLTKRATCPILMQERRLG